MVLEGVEFKQAVLVKLYVVSLFKWSLFGLVLGSANFPGGVGFVSEVLACCCLGSMSDCCVVFVIVVGTVGRCC